MKKILTMVVICCMLVCSISAFAAAESIIINGEVANIPANMGRIYEKDDRTFVPVRFVTEYLGCVVNYNEAQESANITDPTTGIAYFMINGDNKLFVLADDGGKVISMDTTVFINNDEGRMYVPVRFLAEAIGYTVDWDEATQIVTLTSAQ